LLGWFSSGAAGTIKEVLKAIWGLFWKLIGERWKEALIVLLLSVVVLILWNVLKGFLLSVGLR